ncbi:MAG: VWA domain-containing protein [Acidobacteriaceae bacterium]|nr:VWA domain-containing protein [Acidobacteriaceae bacterium]MBV9763503.1 VWA domain-containing protein [Acidobacteriaceae bacterium]
MKFSHTICALLLCIGSWRPLAGQGVTFKDSVKLIEVYATVFDHGGRAVEGLTRDQFEVRDDGEAQPIRIFEPTNEALACALLLDTTGSMADSMPELKTAARDFIQALRPSDSVGVYAFSQRLEELQEMTMDRAASRRALTRLRAGGRTALFDAVSQLSLELEKRPGKKVMVVLTDGGDNASVLTRESAAARAQKAGVPVFAIAEGDALRDGAASGLLRELAESTGGHMYKANRASDIAGIFQAIAHDLQNGYLLAFQSPAEHQVRPWHELRILVKNTEKPVQVRARSGYPGQ